MICHAIRWLELGVVERADFQTVWINPDLDTIVGDNGADMSPISYMR